ncbi:NAD(P)/FAD-dependent oxidoreductase [Algibacter amylolyticus]|uniref:NAD(P)/FAD-dependent oxidoreductase n=1 Tax=Algibacter amylolyticus TaxID=1608400 RepID=A0A5M7BGT1_9FLAO|nr:FAD-dependent oxidoreductase [Algibacter amylolyticus]KAA5827668.1 NAD(P)/FAD-dependent oxidoreductase [Algibacter amylolyticus]MBB5266883.1 thioredoxin reductase [Algibacter amylolyticus]TSJ81913.1 NAD(P)/FAD-dependent oxidoreductase [Algibacter amylolyticus]
MYDALIIGGGAAGLSCALVIGSAQSRAYASDKTIGIITHQKTSHLQTALFNNVLGLTPGTTGASILESGKKQLSDLYSHIEQIDNEKVLKILKQNDGFEVTTNKSTYTSKIVVITVGYTSLTNIEGLEQYIEPHPRAAIEKDRIWLKNADHLIEPNLYVAGTLAGWRSQFAIASGSGAHVATDILTLWNGGKHAKVHDKV